MWSLPGYGEFLDELNPGTVERMAEMGAPVGFENVVASLAPIAAEAAEAPHWGVTFGVDDADATAEKAAKLGGKVLVEPFDAPWGRTTVIADPRARPSPQASSSPRTRTCRSRAAGHNWD